MYIFSMENPFFRFVGRVTDLVWINLLTLICCLPIFTIGAAVSAMYGVLLRIHEDGGGALTRGYFRNFRDNFKNATKIWIPALTILLVLFSNAYLIYQGVLVSYGILQTAAGICIGIIAVTLLVYLQYVLALLARYDTDLKTTMKNAILLEAAFFPRSLCIFIMLCSPIALMTLSNYFLFFWFVYGISFPAYFISMLLYQIFLKTANTTGKSVETDHE